jgi:nitroreductase
MDTEHAIRTRRTVKAFDPQPVERSVIDELLELARWAPNHHLTNPWRFRVLGPHSLERLKAVAADIAAADCPENADVEEVRRAAAAKLDRAPTLIVCSVVRSAEPAEREEDRDAAACAAYIVLLAAHARGLAGYWRTPGVLRDQAGRGAVALPDGEDFVGLLHLGRARQEMEPPERTDPGGYVTYLD